MGGSLESADRVWGGEVPGDISTGVEGGKGDRKGALSVDTECRGRGGGRKGAQGISTMAERKGGGVRGRNPGHQYRGC